MRWSTASLLHATLLALLAWCVGAQAAKAGHVTFTNDQRFLFDVDGNQVDVLGAKVNFWEGRYYIYSYNTANSSGSFPAPTPVVSYASVDLVNWKYLGSIIDASNSPAYLYGGGRPHIVYNAKTKKYVLWVNLGSDGYTTYTSNSPSSGFIVNPNPAKIDPQFTGLQPADFSVEVIDGKGYVVFSVLNFMDPRAGSIWPPIFQTMHVAQLTDDFQSIILPSSNVTSPEFDLIDQEAESPDIFKRNDTYYIAASNTCGWCNGSIGLVYRSQDIKGPWERQIISGFSCDGQVEGVLPLLNPRTNETTYVWHSSTVPGDTRISFNGHIFQPLKFRPDGSVKDLDCARDATFPVTFMLGDGAPATGRATAATDGSPRFADYEYVCDSEVWTLYQTWTNSKTGNLKDIAISVQGYNQQTNLSVTVFRYSNNQDLVAPSYKWETLSSLSIPSSSLLHTFNAFTIPVNAAVKAGDKLGFSFAGADILSYCHLEYSNTDSSKVLFQKAGPQNSWRGKNGKKNIVYERIGKGMKFFTEVV